MISLFLKRIFWAQALRHSLEISEQNDRINLQIRLFWPGFFDAKLEPVFEPSLSKISQEAKISTTASLASDPCRELAEMFQRCQKKSPIPESFVAPLFKKTPNMGNDQENFSRDDFSATLKQTIFQELKRVQVPAEKDYLTRLFLEQWENHMVWNTNRSKPDGDFSAEIQRLIDSIQDEEEQQAALVHWARLLGEQIRAEFLRQRPLVDPTDAAESQTFWQSPRCRSWQNLLGTIADQLEDLDDFEQILLDQLLLAPENEGLDLDSFESVKGKILALIREAFKKNEAAFSLAAFQKVETLLATLDSDENEEVWDALTHEWRSFEPRFFSEANGFQNLEDGLLTKLNRFASFDEQNFRDSGPQHKDASSKNSSQAETTGKNAPSISFFGKDFFGSRFFLQRILDQRNPQKSLQTLREWFSWTFRPAETADVNRSEINPIHPVASDFVVQQNFQNSTERPTSLSPGETENRRALATKADCLAGLRKLATDFETTAASPSDQAEFSLDAACLLQLLGQKASMRKRVQHVVSLLPQVENDIQRARILEKLYFECVCQDASSKAAQTLLAYLEKTVDQIQQDDFRSKEWVHVLHRLISQNDLANAERFLSKILSPADQKLLQAELALCQLFTKSAASNDSLKNLETLLQTCFEQIDSLDDEIEKTTVFLSLTRDFC